jgi:hypothetical protein
MQRRVPAFYIDNIASIRAGVTFYLLNAQIYILYQQAWNIRLNRGVLRGEKI